MRWAIIVPWAASLVITAKLFTLIYDYYYGTLNLILQTLHITSGPIDFLGDDRWTMASMIVVGIFVSVPFVAREVVPTLREIGNEQEQAAHTLGASGWQTFWRITLPSIRWAVIYGVVLTTARCLGEYGAVAVVSGHIQGQTETATLRVEERYDNFDLPGAYAISLVLAAMAVIVLVTMTLIRPREETV
jgi:sulfate transport system permease protein